MQRCVHYHLREEDAAVKKKAHQSTLELIAELELFNHHESARRLKSQNEAILTALEALNENDRQRALETLAKAIVESVRVK